MNKYLDISEKICIFVIENKVSMKPRFKIGQYLVIKWQPVDSVMPTPLGLMYSSKNEYVYGVWRVEQYKPDCFDNIDYKVHLVPVGESAKIFLPMDRYTCDYNNIQKEMIFDDWKLAERFVNEFLTD